MLVPLKKSMVMTLIRRGKSNDVSEIDVPKSEVTQSKVSQREDSHRPNQFFTSEECEWPPSSEKYFLREHNNSRDGMQSLVYNSLIVLKQNAVFDGLIDK